MSSTRMSKETIIIKKGEKFFLNVGSVLILPDELEKAVGGVLTTAPKGARSGRIVMLGPKHPMQARYGVGMTCRFNFAGCSELEFEGQTYILAPWNAILCAYTTQNDEGTK